MMGVLRFVAVALVIAGCTCGRAEPAVPPEAELDRSPAPLPEGWLYEVAIDGDAALARIREVLPEGQARALFPSRVVDLADQMVGTTTAQRAAITEDSPLRCIALGGRSGPVGACALRVRADAGLEGTPGAPRGASWVEAGERAAAIAGDVLVIAGDRSTLEQALPWLAFTAMPEDPPRVARLRAAEHVAGTLRADLDRFVAEHAREARETVAAERSAHAEAPALGEPEAVISWLEAALAERLALLPDLGGITVELDVDASGLVIDARAEVRPETPLARRIEGAGTSPVRGLRELPEGTVLAWASVEDEASREGASGAISERLAAIGGERLDARARTTVDTALAAWADVRGDATVAAIGLDAEGAWAAIATRSPHVPPIVPFRDALAIDWADAALATPLGCERIDPRDTDFDDAITLCDGAHLARGAHDGASSLVIAQGTLDQARERARSLAERIATERAAIGASPDVERVMGARDPEGTFFVGYLVPSAIPTLIGRLAPSLRDRVATSARGAAFVVRAVREDGAVRLEARASRDAIADLLALVDPRTQE
ncbi:hypothetical protein [Sandaracinus amylolyticus]|uniref:hypothetical protein n=1 Tax=Sandaracinus amylolyticus TaxID=927083 RepID=UPI001F19C270|nr:hypothetical protein [Sandaracinus amylolyticus]UJR84719.1 Hypothetical protein I5071_67980 [Sandaracinus amylolyticus]